MSTRKIREALERLHKGMRGSEDLDAYRAGLAEVEAIERAAQDIEVWQTGMVPPPRERVAKAFDVLSAIAKETST